MSIQLASKRLDKLIALLCTHQSATVRFFGVNAACMTRIVSYDFPTMATDGKTLYVNPDFLLKRSDSANCFTLIHEAFHKVAKHNIRLRDCAPGQKDLVHHAADYAINLALELDSNQPFAMPDDGLINRDFVDGSGMALNAERIIPLIMQQQAEQQQDESGDSDGNGDSNSQQSGSNAADSDDDGQQDSTAAADSGTSSTDDSEQDTGSDTGNSGQDSGLGTGSDDYDQQDTTPDSTGDLLPAPDDFDEAESMLDTAKAEVIAGAGNLPGYLKEIIKDSLTTASRDWMSEVHQELAKTFDRSDYSLRKPNMRYRQFGIIAPSLRAPAVNKIAIVRDTSGSMSNEELTLASAQIKNIVDTWSPLETIIIDHDSRITQVETLTVGMQPMNVDALGRGGTNFQPVMDYLEPLGVDAVLWITDCMPLDKPTEPTFPVIYLAVEKSNRWYYDRYLNHGRYIDLT